jgi:hypothetical protein
MLQAQLFRRLTHLPPSCFVPFRLQNHPLIVQHAQRSLIRKLRKAANPSAASMVAFRHKTAALGPPFPPLLTMWAAYAVTFRVGLLALCHLWLTMNHVHLAALLRKFFLRCYFLSFEQSSATIVHAFLLFFEPSLLTCIRAFRAPGPTSLDIFAAHGQT